MNAITAYLFSMTLFVVAAITRPTSAECPHGWWLDGIRTSGDRVGEFGCRPVPRAVENQRPYRPVLELDADEDVEIYSRLWCEGETQPRALDDGRGVMCWPTAPRRNR